MRLLYIPQLSMRNYRTGKYSILSDAQFTKCKGLLFSLIEQDKDIDITLILPETMHNTLTEKVVYTMHTIVEHFVNIFGKERQEAIRTKFNIELNDKFFGPNVALSRFNFPWEVWFDVIYRCRPDIIINEIASLTPNFAMLRDYMEVKFKIATVFIHIIDEYIQYQINGYMKTDAVIFPSIAHKQRWNEYTSGIIPIDCHKGKTFIWPHCYCETEIQNARQEINIDEKRILVFPSRFSDLERTRSDYFCEIAKNLVNRFDDLYIHILNPNEALTLENVKLYRLDHPRIIVHMRPLSRKQYIELLIKAEFGCILQTLDKIPSISLVEMIAAGVKVFLFRTNIPFEYISLGDESSLGQRFIGIGRITNLMTIGIEKCKLNKGLDEILHRIQCYSTEFCISDISSNLRQILRG